MAFDKSIIPVTDINGWFIWQRMNISSKYHFRNIIKLSPAFEKMGEQLFDQTA
jgi:acetyl-CoA C-acetyltransferase